MPLVPSNVNFQIGDILTATQYNETHNTTAKLALEDNSRIVLPNSSAPTNIANGHWVLGAIAGDYINFNGVGSISTPSVFLYDLNALEWLVYPLVNTAVNTDMSLTVWDAYTYYVANKDFVFYVNALSKVKITCNKHKTINPNLSRKPKQLKKNHVPCNMIEIIKLTKSLKNGRDL